MEHPVPTKSLDERLDPRQMADGPAATTESSTHQYLIFDVADQSCALRIEDVRSVVFMAELVRPPSTFSALAGFMNLGGKALPVLHLTRLLGLPDQTPTLYTPVIVLGGADAPFALLAQSVRRLISLPDSAFVPLPHQHVADRALTIDSRIVAILAPQRLLLEEERRRLAELQESQQRRLSELQEVSA